MEYGKKIVSICVIKKHAYKIHVINVNENIWDRHTQKGYIFIIDEIKDVIAKVNVYLSRDKTMRQLVYENDIFH